MRIAVGVTMGIAVEVAVEIATEVAMGIIEANVDFFFQIKSQKSTNSPFLVADKKIVELNCINNMQKLD